MGTHSNILFCRRTLDGKIVRYVMVYHQYDGHLQGVGIELATFLKNINYIRNGFNLNDRHKLGQIANGLGCMVAQYVALQKKEVGNFYIESTDSPMTADYNYTVIYDETKNTTFVSVNHYKLTPEMTIGEFYDYCTKGEEEDGEEEDGELSEEE